MYDFLIDLHPADLPRAEWVAAVLEEAGYSVMLPDWDIRPGDNKPLAKNRALESCRHTLGIVTSEYVESESWTALAAVQQGMKGKHRAYIPVLFEDVVLPPLADLVECIRVVRVGEEDARQLLLDGVLERINQKRRSDPHRHRLAAFGTRRRIRKEVVLPSVVVGCAIVLLGTWDSWRRDAPGGTDQVPSPRCSEVGYRASGIPHPEWLEEFTRAYEAAGGEAQLGCPVEPPDSGFVHRWGPGMSQDFIGGRAGVSRIMKLLGPGKTIVMSGEYYRNYTRYGRTTADDLGYPIGEPISCGPSLVVPLVGGSRSPGALVTSPTGRFVWFPDSIWAQYLERGGPRGELGRPEDRPVDRVPWIFESGGRLGPVPTQQWGTVDVDSLLERLCPS